PARSQLINFSDAERSLALEHFQMLRPFLEDQMPLPEIARTAGISLRAARYWVKRYRQRGLVGLVRKIRYDTITPSCFAFSRAAFCFAFSRAALAWSVRPLRS